MIDAKLIACVAETTLLHIKVTRLQNNLILSEHQSQKTLASLIIVELPKLILSQSSLDQRPSFILQNVCKMSNHDNITIGHAALSNNGIRPRLLFL
jgi:hypothetical protein